jgi:hypothetical protein
MPTLLDAGNLFLFISGFLMFYTAYKDRSVLRGYDPLGTSLLIIGLTLILGFYVQEGYWISFILTLPNYSYWLVVGYSLLIYN